MRKIRVSIILIFLLFLFISCFQISKTPKENNHKYSWNNGYCELDGGRLTYIGTGNKEHFKCDICGKEYTFDGLFPRKNK